MRRNSTLSAHKTTALKSPSMSLRPRGGGRWSGKPIEPPRLPSRFSFVQQLELVSRWRCCGALVLFDGDDYQIRFAFQKSRQFRRIIGQRDFPPQVPGERDALIHAVK